jgi:hypothetical protein
VYFTLIALFELVVLRKLGWSLSKRVFYPWPDFAAGLAVGVWGPLIAALVWLLVWQFHPNLFLEAVFGWALGAYLAVPNYGLFAENSIPDSVQKRHRFVSRWPLFGYLILAPWFAFLAHRFPHH